MDGLNSTFLAGWPIFRDYVNFREGMNQTNSTKNRRFCPNFHPSVRDPTDFQLQRQQKGLPESQQKHRPEPRVFVNGFLSIPRWWLSWWLRIQPI